MCHSYVSYVFLLILWMWYFPRCLSVLLSLLFLIACICSLYLMLNIFPVWPMYFSGQSRHFIWSMPLLLYLSINGCTAPSSSPATPWIGKYYERNEKGGSTNQTKEQWETILKSNISVYINKQSTKQKLPTSIENINKETSVKQATKPKSLVSVRMWPASSGPETQTQKCPK
jgi:hypothetical protein